MQRVPSLLHERRALALSVFGRIRTSTGYALIVVPLPLGYEDKMG